jgi:tRNA threonylcarbamoyladenosine biosynthesis protein TsaB
VKTDRGDGPWVGCGSGWDTYESELRESLGGNVIQVLTNQFPRASVVARLGVKGLENGLSVGAEHAQPVYLRNNVVKV